MKTLSKLSILIVIIFMSNTSFAQEVVKAGKPKTVEQSKEAVAPDESIVIEVDEIVDSVQITDSGEIFVFVEDQPSFPGGEKARLKYLQENIHYPEVAKEAGVQGIVYITFLIEKDGRITNVKVLRGVGGGLDEESVRVIKSMPNWEPGRQRGKAVRCQFNMLIRFLLADG